MFVTEVMVPFMYLFLILYMPSAAAVPTTVAIREDRTARIRVLRSAVKVSVELKSSLYHLKLKPVKTAVLLDSLKEKNIRVRHGS